VVDDRQESLDRETGTLWHIMGFGVERHPPGVRYWFENRERDTQVVVFQYVVSGELQFRDAKREVHAVRAGSALLFMHGEDTAYGLSRHATETLMTEFVSFAGSGVREHWGLLRTRSSVLEIDPAGPLLPAMRQVTGMTALGQPRDSVGMATALHTFTMLLFAGERQAHARTQSPVERALDDLLRSPTSPWSLKQLAERHGVSREHFTRMFHSRLGEAPAHYLARVRRQRAMELLAQTALPVAEVARQAGYASTHTMARQVRLFSGLSPRAIRRRQA
jgi:AraC-like DNA-binding protein